MPNQFMKNSYSCYSYVSNWNKTLNDSFKAMIYYFLNLNTMD